MKNSFILSAILNILQNKLDEIKTNGVNADLHDF
jgi:hypothetical protein